MSKSIEPTAARKSVDRPKKPPGFPLGPHPSGKWQKKVDGKIEFFGRWGKVVNGTMKRIPGDGIKEALAEYQAFLINGKKTPKSDDGFTVKDLGNEFLNVKLLRLQSAEINGRTFAEYKQISERLVDRFGSRIVTELQPRDFDLFRAELAKRCGPSRLTKEIVIVKMIFKFAYDSGSIDKPVRYGQGFARPTKATLRKHRAQQPKKLFTAQQVRTLIDAAGVPLRAMVLLGINCGFGNSDVATLPMSAVDLDGGWITFPRPKTGVARRAKLWPETVEALRTAIESRPTPRDKADASLYFLTKQGHAWVRSREGGVQVDAVCQEFSKLQTAAGVKTAGSGFYAIRHTFRTIADATKDFPACRMIMGHTDGGIDDFYVEGIDDARLIAVSEYVRAWLPVSSPRGEKEGGAE